MTSDRDLRILARHSQGRNLQSIGDEFNISRERVRQILNRNGITDRNGRPEYFCIVSGCYRMTKSKVHICAYHYMRRYNGLSDWPMPVEPAKHGSRTMYEHHGCRCAECVEGQRRAVREAKKARYAERDAEGIHPRAPHGTPSGYTNWGCRCLPCKLAGVKQNKLVRERRKAKEAK